MCGQVAQQVARAMRVACADLPQRPSVPARLRRLPLDRKVTCSFQPFAVLADQPFREREVVERQLALAQSKEVWQRPLHGPDRTEIGI